MREFILFKPIAVLRGQREQSLGFKCSDATPIFRNRPSWAANIFIQILLRFQVASSYAEPLFTLFQNCHTFYAWNTAVPYLKTQVHACVCTHTPHDKKPAAWKRYEKPLRIAEKIASYPAAAGGITHTFYLTSLFFLELALETATCYEALC